MPNKLLPVTLITEKDSLNDFLSTCFDLWLYICFIVFVRHGCSLRNAPFPLKKNAPIGLWKSSSKEQKAEQNNLKKKRFPWKRYEGLKKDLIYIAGKVQTHESNLFALEQRLSQLKRQIEYHQSSRLKKKVHCRFGLALEHIRRIPPETLIARPDAHWNKHKPQRSLDLYCRNLIAVQKTQTRSGWVGSYRKWVGSKTKIKRNHWKT